MNEDAIFLRFGRQVEADHEVVIGGGVASNEGGEAEVVLVVLDNLVVFLKGVEDGLALLIDAR